MADAKTCNWTLPEKSIDAVAIECSELTVHFGVQFNLEVSPDMLYNLLIDIYRCLGQSFHTKVAESS